LKKSPNSEISEERIPRIVSKMLRGGVIYDRGKMIYLTTKGENLIG
jgi:hypothetical protein